MMIIFNIYTSHELHNMMHNMLCQVEFVLSIFTQKIIPLPKIYVPTPVTTVKPIKVELIVVFALPTAKNFVFGLFKTDIFKMVEGTCSEIIPVKIKFSAVFCIKRNREDNSFF